MAETIDLRDLASLYGSWESEELARAVGEEADTYSPEALALMRGELERRGERPAELAAAASTVLAEERARQRERFRGLKGFLVLMLVDIATRSLWGLAGVAMILRGQPRRTDILIALLFTAMGLYGLFICLLLARRNRRAPREAAAWLVLTLATTGLVAYMFWQNGQLKWPVAILFYPVVWLAYLWKSRRVKVTFGPPAQPAPDLAAFD